MTHTQAQLCEIGKAILGEGSEPVAVVLSRCAEMIKSQVEQIDDLERKYLEAKEVCKELTESSIALSDACNTRIAELERKCALLEKARTTDPKCVAWYAAQHDFDQQRIAELEAQLERSQKVLAWELKTDNSLFVTSDEGLAFDLFQSGWECTALIARCDAAIPTNKEQKK